VSVKASPIKDGIRDAIGVAKVAREHYRSKRAEGVLQEREAQMRLMPSTVPPQSPMLDSDLKYIVASQTLDGRLSPRDQPSWVAAIRMVSRYPGNAGEINHGGCGRNREK